MIEFNGTIVCASKYFTANEIVKISKFGITNFGENRVDDLLHKKKELEAYNFTWHFIGKLQTNKIKMLVNEISFLHSLETISQAKLIQKYSNSKLKCFIQLNISEETTKSGINISKIDDFIKELKKYDKIQIVGFMTMGVQNNEALTNQIFAEANRLKTLYNLEYLSMGMTDDYQIAINNHATHLRIGSYFKNLIGG